MCKTLDLLKHYYEITLHDASRPERKIQSDASSPMEITLNGATCRYYHLIKKQLFWM